MAVHTSIEFGASRYSWRDKRDEILKLMPGIDRERFVYTLATKDYEREYGGNYKKPGLVAKILAGRSGRLQ